jgi:hypothetical protein
MHITIESQLIIFDEGDDFEKQRNVIWEAAVAVIHWRRSKNSSLQRWSPRRSRAAANGSSRYYPKKPVRRST